MAAFASDNWSGVHARVLELLQQANEGQAPAYGDDPWTARATELLRGVLGRPDAEVFFVFLGTAANVLALKCLCRPYHAVLCSDAAHIHRDECGAPEAMAGIKLLPVATEHGRLRPDDLRPYLADLGVVHHSQPRVVSVTQATEYGTVYRPQEIAVLADFAHHNGLLLHMDGARLANAAAFLDLPLAELTAGVDVLSFGGTKNGLMGAEAVVFLRPGLATEFGYVRKQGLQLASKMRFVAAQFVALLEDDLWLASARQANAMARLLADRAAALPGVEITRPVEANAVFARLPAAAVEALQPRFPFYVWDGLNAARPEVRWMTAFDTRETDVLAFAAVLADCLRG